MNRSNVATGSVRGVTPSSAMRALTAGELPPATDYRGEIRRGADGILIALPESSTNEPVSATASPGARTLVVGASERISSLTEAARQARDGDIIELDVPSRRLELLVSKEDLARRRAEWTPPEPPKGGYASLYVNHVLQSDAGCDFDFLVGQRGAGIPRHSH